MNKKPKLIMLYGFAGIGKSTLAKRLNKDMALSLCIEADNILVMIGQWLPNERIAREYVYEITKSMIKTYLMIGHDVIIPYLLLDNHQALELEQIATNLNANFVELYLRSNKAESIKYLYERGTWGELGSPPITEKDLPHIEEIFDKMVEVMKCRSKCIEVPYTRNNIEQTYKEIKNNLLVNIK